MGIFDSLQQMATSAMGGGDNAKVAGGFITAAEQHPGGLGGLLDMMKGNGLGQHVNNWSNGEATPVEPAQVEQGLGGGFINQIASHAGVSPAVVTVALSTMLPMIIQHFSNNSANGQTAEPGQTGMGGGLSDILSKFTK